MNYEDKSLLNYHFINSKGKYSFVDSTGAGDTDSTPGPGSSPEKETATHSSVLAWRIPGTGEPGGLLSMGSDRVGHD